jgi:DNA-binding SARP family transcriptional activator
VEASVGAGVGKVVEFTGSSRFGSEPSVQIRMLGGLTISRRGESLSLPASRKVRALLAYLTLSPRAAPRSRLCELLWETPNDPRGELRWCLSKLRRVLDEPGRRRIEARGDTIRLDLSDCFVDVLEIARATQDGVASLDAERLRTLNALFNGELLEDLAMDRNPSFNAWLVAERHRLRGRQIALLERLVKCTEGEEVFAYLQKWLQLAPFDRQVHEILLSELARRGRMSEGEQHVAAAARLFESEGLEHASIRNAWRAAKAKTTSTPPALAKTAAHATQVALANAAKHWDTRERPSIAEGEVAQSASHRASIAVMPFVHDTSDPGGCADGLVHDVITRLAKLRSLFVIAQGSVFALRERHVGPAEAGRILNVDYIVTGSVRPHGRRLNVAVELVETRTAHIVWSDTFDQRLEDTFLVLEEIGSKIVSAIASEVEANERNRAILKPPNSLNAWEAYHRGLWHMYRFDKSDNDRARHFFEMAVRLDPTFARAYAGLSFTHFQDAFQGWSERNLAVDRAFAIAGQSLMADDRDPAAHWAMGRALWLRGRQNEAVIELERTVDLSPNFALGHYTLAFVNAQSGDPHAAIESADHSRHLSPCDPMLYAMLAAHAIALVRLEKFDEAAEWASKSAARPNAHPHVRAAAAYTLALAGLLNEARACVAEIHKVQPNYSVADFLHAFQYDEHGAALFRKGAELLSAPAAKRR